MSRKKCVRTRRKYDEELKEEAVQMLLDGLRPSRWYPIWGSAPNPVYEELWGFEPGRYRARRDLPMDLYEARVPRHPNNAVRHRFAVCYARRRGRDQ